MNPLERALFELRADMARNPGGLTEGELKDLLAEIAAESDAHLRATALLFRLDLELLEESAAIMEYDGGLARVTANRLALTQELQRRYPGTSESLCRWFSQNAAVVIEYGWQHDLTREQLFESLKTYFHNKTHTNDRKTKHESNYDRD